uniref:Protein root UVB sensitive/RUS domain-containing protein n=2 Tax=Aegilops tauschii subsp. strangulata TaxID=200361 RepID=A0A453DVU6_AEGTS
KLRCLSFHSFHLPTGQLGPRHRSMLTVGGRFQGGAPPWRRPRPRSRLASPPASSSGAGDSEKARPLLVERYRDGAAKRYMLDGDSKLQVQWEKHDESSTNTVEDENANSSIPRAVSDFVLPAGFPESVSDDYLQYMLLQFPTNVTGWICHTLVTSSLLKMGIKRWHRSFWTSSYWWTIWNTF